VKGGLMMKNKKGLSTIVATLIIILLVLVAVGIIWVVVRNVLEGGAGQITSGYECTNAVVKPTKVNCDIGDGDIGNDGRCDVTYTRSAGGEEIGGIKIILTNAEENFIIDVPNNIPELATRTEDITSNLDNVTKVETAVYFVDDSGNEIICDPSGYMNLQIS
jgi:hypothetical protein